MKSLFIILAFLGNFFLNVVLFAQEVSFTYPDARDIEFERMAFEENEKLVEGDKTIRTRGISDVSTPPPKVTSHKIAQRRRAYGLGLRQFEKNNKPIPIAELCQKEYEPLVYDIQYFANQNGIWDVIADGECGPTSRWAMTALNVLMGFDENRAIDEKTIQKIKDQKIPKLNLKDDLASRLVNYMLWQNKQPNSPAYFISRCEGCVNIIYLENADREGRPIEDDFTSDRFNDRRILLVFENNRPKIIGNWAATSGPGTHYTNNPLKPKGAARIGLAQFKGWQVGKHQGKYEALVQTKQVLIHRDLNKDGARTGDRTWKENAKLNQHHGYDEEYIGVNSAGCLVGQTIKGHKTFMRLVKKDPRYQINHKYIFRTTILTAVDLARVETLSSKP